MLTILLLLFCTIPACLFAQTAKNSWLIGGNAHIRYEADSGPVSWNSNFNPNVGYFFSNNFVLGLALPVEFNSQRSTSSSQMIGMHQGQMIVITKNTRTGFGIVPFIRKYIGKDKFKPFLQAQAGLSRRYTTLQYETLPSRRIAQNSGIASGGVGISYFVSQHVGIEALLNGTYSDDFAFGFPPTSIGLYFGIQFYLPGKNKEE